MNTKYKFWIVVSLIAVFGIGLATGYFSERYIVHKRQESRRPPHFPTVESLAKDLDLTQDQQDRVREVFRKNEERLKAFGEDFHKRIDKIRAELKSEVDAILSPEQVRKLESLIEEYMKKDKQGRNSHDKMPEDASRHQDKGEHQ
jgi:Spy/CpxP family protein refolding chaperone